MIYLNSFLFERNVAEGKKLWSRTSVHYFSSFAAKYHFFTQMKLPHYYLTKEMEMGNYGKEWGTPSYLSLKE